MILACGSVDMQFVWDTKEQGCEDMIGLVKRESIIGLATFLGIEVKKKTSTLFLSNSSKNWAKCGRNLMYTYLRMAGIGSFKYGVFGGGKRVTEIIVSSRSKTTDDLHIEILF